MLAHEQDVGGVAGGQGERAQVFGLQVVQVGLAGAARHHRGKRDSHIDPPTSSNAIMQKAQPLLRRE